MKRMILLAALCCATPLAAGTADDLMDEADGEEQDGDLAVASGDGNYDSLETSACYDYKAAVESYINATDLLLEAANYNPGLRGYVMSRVEEIQGKADNAASMAEDQCAAAYGDDSGDSGDYEYEDDYEDDYGEDY